MRVMFVGGPFETIALECLSAYLREHGHETSLAYDPRLFNNAFMERPRLARLFEVREAVATQAASWEPDAVAFTSTGYEMPWIRDMAARIKRRRPVPVIVGGPQAWVSPESVLDSPSIDFVVRGEGERPLIEILDRIASGDLDRPIEGTLHRHDGRTYTGPTHHPAHSLDDLPHPDKALFYDRMGHLDGYTILTSRSCPFTCTYCFYGAVSDLDFYRAGRQRRLSPGRTVEQLEEGTRRWGSRNVRFFDNDFVYNIPWLEEFADEYARRVARPYHAQGCPRTLTDRAVEALRRSGCFEVQIGVETLNPETKRAIGRNETADDVRQAVARLRRAGIRSSLDMILALPGDTPEDGFAAADFFAAERPTKVNVYWLAYQPLAPIVDLARCHGALTPEQAERIGRGELPGNLFHPHEAIADTASLRRVQALMMAAPILPARWYGWMKRWARRRGWAAPAATLTWILAALATRHPQDMHRVRYAGLHREFAPRALLWKWFGIPGTRKPRAVHGDFDDPAGRSLRNATTVSASGQTSMR